MDKQMILSEEVKQVIYSAEKTGNKIFD